MNVLDAERVNNEFVKERTNAGIKKAKTKGRDTSKMVANLSVLDTNTKALSDLGKHIIDNTSGSIYKTRIDRFDMSTQTQNRDMVRSVLFGPIVGSVTSDTSTKPGYVYTYKNNKKGTRRRVK